MEDERARFEEWAKEFGFPDLKQHPTSPRDYAARDVTMAWQGWQGRSSSQSERIADEAEEKARMMAAINKRDERIARLEEALRSFVYEFGDKTNSATVNKARKALEQQ